MMGCFSRLYPDCRSSWDFDSPFLRLISLLLALSLDELLTMWSRIGLLLTSLSSFDFVLAQLDSRQSNGSSSNGLVVDLGYARFQGVANDSVGYGHAS